MSYYECVNCERFCIIVFLPPNVTSVVKPLDLGIIASFKVQYKKKLLEWVLSQFDSSTTQHTLR